MTKSLSSRWLPLFGRRLFAATALALICSFAQGEEKKEKVKANPASDESAIQGTLESYVDAYNRGDAKAVAAHWSESGEWTNPTGERISGVAAIEKSLGEFFAQNKGLRIEVLQPAIRLVSADVAVEEGTARIIYRGEAPSDSTYVAIHVKRDGKWKLDSVHETALPETPAASAALQELSWLVGEWVDNRPDATIETNVAWTKNKTFLSYSFKVSMPDSDPLEGAQVIGWDPIAGVIRSWMFDSDGGFGEGIWTQKDHGWVVRFRQVLPDGRVGSATNVYTLIDGNTYTWKSIGRKIDDEFLPNMEETKIVRKGTGEPEAELPVKQKPEPPVKQKEAKK